MNTIAYIHSYPGAAATLAMLWSGFKKLGVPLIGVDCRGEPTSWPEPIPTIEAGVNAYATEDRYNLPSRLIETLQHFLTTRNERCVVMEYDSLILKPMPDYPPGFVGTYAGGRLDGSEASCFFHTPWIFDRETAELFIKEGMALMLDGKVMSRGPLGVHSSPDMFIGLIIDRCGARWTDSGAFSRNTIHSPEDIALARKAISDGAWFLHGVKTREQLDAITAA